MRDCRRVRANHAVTGDRRVASIRCFAQNRRIGEFCDDQRGNCEHANHERIRAECVRHARAPRNAAVPVACDP